MVALTMSHNATFGGITFMTPAHVEYAVPVTCPAWVLGGDLLKGLLFSFAPFELFVERLRRFFLVKFLVLATCGSSCMHGGIRVVV